MPLVTATSRPASSSERHTISLPETLHLLHAVAGIAGYKLPLNGAVQGNVEDHETLVCRRGRQPLIHEAVAEALYFAGLEICLVYRTEQWCYVKAYVLLVSFASAL